MHQASGSNPGSELCTLDDPASFSASGVNAFSAPTSGDNLCPKLTHSTTYFVVLTRANSNSSTITLSVTSSNAEDAGSANGWSIQDGRSSFSGGAWTSSTAQPYMIEVKGDTVVPIASDNLTWVDNRRGYAATGYGNTGSFTIAQGFRTGDTVGIFEVHEIHVDFDRGQPQTDTVKVSIVESTSPNDDWEFATPFHFQRGGNYNPQTVTTDGVHTFRRAFGNSALRANTNYFLVIESTSDNPLDAAIVRMTNSDDETSDDGWTVDDYSHSKNKQPNATWTKQDHQVRFRISGSHRQGIGMAGDSYAFESCVELRRGERTNCVAAIAVPEPADPENPPENVSKSGLTLNTDNFPGFTGWWQWMHQYIAFPVTMNPLPTGTDYVTMFVGTRDHTAESGQDYWGSSESIRFDASSNHTQVVNLRIIDDRVEDSGDYFEFFLFQCRDQNGNHCDHQFVDSTVRGIIYNTEESREISYLNVSDVTVTEGEDAKATFTVSLTAPVTGTVQFDYATHDGTAKDGTDYTGGSGTALIGNGDTSVTLSVDITNDDAWTGDRSFTLKISNAVFAAIDDDTGWATIKDDDPRGLTAQFTNLPEGNHGESSFKFNIAFNQAVGTKYLVMQNDVMVVTNGEVTRAERINGARDFWKITVQPESGEDVTVLLPATTHCSAIGAVCTRGAEPQPLSNSVSHTFPGTALNASFTRFEWYHNGKTPLNLELTFSEEVDTDAAEIKDHALTVTGGAVETVVQKDQNSTRRWTIVVRPAGTGAIDVILPSATDCAFDGHICTAEGELLAQGDWKTSAGPPAISVADATVTEGDDAELAFAVTLDRSWFGTVPTVSYSTSDGTATAGSDYTAASGTLTLIWTATGSLTAPWALTGTITVPVAKDALTEGDESLTLTLSSPTWATLGDAVATGTIQDSTAEEAETLATPDSQPTGLPAITGTPQVDQPLTADTSAIDDANGLSGVSYTYQWAATAGDVESDVAGGTGSTLTPRTGDLGKTYRVKVTFTDDDGYSHTLTSLPSGAVAAAQDNVVWSADMAVAEYTEDSIGGANASQFSNIGGSGSLQIRHLWSHRPDKDLRLAFTTAVPDSESMTLTVGDLTLEFPDGSAGNATFKWTSVTVDWEGGDVVKVSIAPTGTEEDTAGIQDEPAANTAAVGKPTVDGTPEVGTALAADVSGISDVDGLTNPNYRYQWLRSTGDGNADISGATAASYTPTPADAGKTLRVRVSLTDDGDNTETLTSDPTAVVATAPPSEPQGLTAAKADEAGGVDASWQAPASNGGAELTGYKLQWKKATGSWDTAADVSEATLTGTAHAITGLEGGTEYSIRVAAVNSAGTGPWSAAASAIPDAPETEDPPAENSAPTGAPTVIGTPEVGQTLSAGVSTINDQDGLDDVSWEYQWLAGGSEITGATGSKLLLTDSHQSKTISVRVDFEDDAGNSETLTSAATVEVAAKPVPLTAALTGLPANHAGAETSFQLTLTFSENIKSGYVKMRDLVFTLSGADITEARRATQGSNVQWLITIRVNTGPHRGGDPHPAGDDGLQRGKGNMQQGHRGQDALALDDCHGLSPRVGSTLNPDSQRPPDTRWPPRFTAAGVAVTEGPSELRPRCPTPR